MLYGIIMAGGSGTRFWPRSRASRPKQLISIVGEKTMLQLTAARLIDELPPQRIMVITNVKQAEESRKQLAMLDGIRIIAEPEGRDTAACIGLAALMVSRDDANAVMAVLPADHVVKPDESFMAALREAERIAVDERALVTIGIKPERPSTQFGYIKRGDPLNNRIKRNMPAFRVESFREKPDRETAESFFKSGEFYWNSGTFIWSASDILAEIERCMPKLYEGLEKIKNALGSPDEDRVIAEVYPTLEKISIDYGVMEQARKVVVLEADYEWDDVGSWEAIARHYPSDDCGNTTIGRVLLDDTKDCIVVSDKEHLIAAMGINGVVIIHSPDATLVCRREMAGEVKKLVEKIKENGMGEYL